MARLTHAQRLDLLEQEIADVSNRVAQEITSALAAFKTDLSAQLAAAQEKTRSEPRSAAANGSSYHWDNPFTGTNPPLVTNEGGEYGGQSNWRLRKLDLPLFDGTNPDGWILRAERFFHFYRLSPEDKLEAAIVALEGDALLWFQWEHRRHTLIY